MSTALVQIRQNWEQEEYLGMGDEESTDYELALHRNE
jgi:hypothetical protein